MEGCFHRPTNRSKDRIVLPSSKLKISLPYGVSSQESLKNIL